MSVNETQRLIAQTTVAEIWRSQRNGKDCFWPIFCQGVSLIIQAQTDNESLAVAEIKDKLALAAHDSYQPSEADIAASLMGLYFLISFSSTDSA